MPFKDKEKRRLYALETYYKNKERWKEKFDSLPEEEKERIRVRRRLSHTKHYQNNKDTIKAKRKSTYNKVRLKSLYNMSIDDYNLLLEQQNNKCAICGIDRATFKNMKLPLCVDHDHETNKIRGLLCNKCNSLLGLANDNIEILTEAIKYLNKYE